MQTTSHNQEILLEGTIKNHEHRMLYKVYFDDTDSGGLMYHANYIKICERARTDSLHISGITYGNLKENQDQPLFVVASLQATYKLPAILEDTLLIRSKIKEIKRSYFIFEQLVYRLKGKLDDYNNSDLLFTMTVKIAYINKHKKPTSIPTDLKNKLIF